MNNETLAASTSPATFTPVPVVLPKDQLELSLPPEPRPRPVRPGTVHRPRRHAVARWWFARMRETVRTVEAWTGPGGATEASSQQDLALVTPPTRFDGRRGPWAVGNAGVAAAA